MRSALIVLLAACASACSAGEATSGDGETKPGPDAATNGGTDGNAGGDSNRDTSAGLDVSPDVDVDGAIGSETGADAMQPCTLTDSGPIVVKANSEVVENLRITSTNGPAVTVNGFVGVTIRNCEIHHRGGHGVTFSNADDIHIENVAIVHEGAPPSGQNPSSELDNISGYGSQRVRVDGARLTRGSSGIYLAECPGAQLRQIEGHDFRGPFPRGQVVQFDKCNDSLLEDFSVVNPAGSWPEDNVNMYKSTNVTVRRGHVDGNNSPSGVGVIFDGDTSTGVVEDVDAIHMGNGCFSAYAGADGSVFRRTRCRENICVSQEGRGAPGSNALMWSGKPGLSQLRIEQSKYFAACNPTNIVWPLNSFAVHDVVEEDFTMRAPITLAFCWE